jgi:fumarylacetoacetase
MIAPDETHDPQRMSWIETAGEPGTDFPIQNLPFCVFRRRGTNGPARIGVGIGDRILDLRAAVGAGVLKSSRVPADCLAAPILNPLMASGRAAWRDLRKAISALLSSEASREHRNQAAGCLIAMEQAEFVMPAHVGDFTDFYASVFHATNVGKMFRPDNPLLPNYKWVPIGYHGRSSSLCVSGTPVVRPRGQIKPPSAATPTFSACRQLDFEAELGFFVGTGNRLGEPIAIGAAAGHVFGVCLLNDWSARDIQAWEYQPLGPFLAKSFASTISPWVVTLEALAPFRCPAFVRPGDDPQPLPYLDDPDDRQSGGIAIEVEILLDTPRMRSAGHKPHRLARVDFGDMYWTVAQMVAHHTSNGCNLQPGDLLGSGTVSSREPGAVGSLIELTQAGRNPLPLPGGESRGFLEDGDTLIMRARAERDGATGIGFGECRAEILPAR